MKVNEGSLDRTLRVIVGLGVLATAFIGPQTPFGYFGIVPLLTGLIGWCPLYSILGFNTCPLKKSG